MTDRRSGIHSDERCRYETGGGWHSNDGSSRATIHYTTVIHNLMRLCIPQSYPFLFYLWYRPTSGRHQHWRH